MTYNTEKRNELLVFFKKSGGQALSVDEICKQILPDNQGKSTIYRIISKLVDEGILRRISDGKTRRVTYQYIYTGGCSEHLHLKCNDCGQLIHLDDMTSHILESRIFKAERFSVDDGALLYGRCEACATKKKVIKL